MKLSVTTRYGINALSDLYSHSSLENNQRKPVSVSDIAERQKIPVNYLEQLFAKLRRKGLLTSIRGAQGGYILAKPANEISLSDIFKALNEPVIFGDCQTENGCKNAPVCPTFNIWQKVKYLIDEVLDNTTLEDLFNEKISLLIKAEKSITDPAREEVKNRAVLRENKN